MSEKKPGFFKRMFSFGGKKTEAETPEEKPQDDAVEAVVDGEQSQPSGLTQGSSAEVLDDPATIADDNTSTSSSSGLTRGSSADGQDDIAIATSIEESGNTLDSRDKPENDDGGEAAEDLETTASEDTSQAVESAEEPETPTTEPTTTPEDPTPAPSPSVLTRGSSADEQDAAVNTTTAEIDEPDQKATTPQKEPEAAPKSSWFQRLTSGLSKSSQSLTGNITSIFTQRKLDADTVQDLEDVLIQADLGVETAMAITDALSANRYGKNISDDEIKTVLADEVQKVLTPVAKPLELDLNHKPHVVLVVGVNGTGKTTTIGKLTAKLTREGLNVMLAAGDTFRAAAIEQLKIWGERTGSPVIARDIGADAAGLAFDAIEAAKEAGSDVLMIDTAGRLQNKAELMAELEKVIRVIKKQDETAPHTVLLTLDATTGQNALQQVEIFKEKAGVNGLVMTKLDGTARGGILVAIAAKHELPVYFIGVGEGIDDLEPFEADEFAKAIAGLA